MSDCIAILIIEANVNLMKMKIQEMGNTVLTHTHQERPFVVCVEPPLSFVVFPHDTKIPVFGLGFYDVTKVTERFW